jgi:hypothetical protein
MNDTLRIAMAARGHWAASQEIARLTDAKASMQAQHAALSDDPIPSNPTQADVTRAMQRDSLESFIAGVTTRIAALEADRDRFAAELVALQAS